MNTLKRFDRICSIGLSLRDVFQKQMTPYCGRRTILTSVRVLLTTQHQMNTLQCSLTKPNHVDSVSLLTVRNKSERKSAKGRDDEDSDDANNASDDDDDDDGGGFNDLEEDFDAPLNFKIVKIHSLRADNLIAKGLRLSKSTIDTTFYQSKLQLNGKTLLKKAKKLQVGDILDLVMNEDELTQEIQRVKVAHILNQTTKKGNPIVVTKVWRKPFQINKS